MATIDDRTAAPAGDAAVNRMAARDILLVLGTLFASKYALLSIDALWVYAGPIALLAALAMASLCLRRNRETWAGLGLRAPSRFSTMLLWSLALLAATIVAGSLVEAGVAAVTAGQPSDIDPRYSRRFDALPGNLALYLSWVAIAWAVGAFAEELIFRAMLFSRFERLLAGFAHPAAIAVVVQALLFGQQHYYYQGIGGALATGTIALISGFAYLKLGRTLWPLILSHGAANIIGLTLIFAGAPPGG